MKPGILQWKIGDRIVTTLNDGFNQASVDIVQGLSRDEAVTAPYYPVAQGLLLRGMYATGSFETGSCENFDSGETNRQIDDVRTCNSPCQQHGASGG